MPTRTELKTYSTTSGDKPATIFVIVMNHKDNRFHPELMGELHSHFDTIEQLVTHCFSHKHKSLCGRN